MSKDTLQLGPTNWDFTTFFRYIVPGLFTAFWVAVYAIRMTNGIGSGTIDSVRSLLNYLFANWQNMIGIMIALGSFLGLLLTGIDPIIRAFMGSRAMNFTFKYLLSSKEVDFAYFQFMRLHDIDYRYERLPKMLFTSTFGDSSSFKELVDGDYSSKYFFRETIQNYFWDQCLDHNAKQGLTHRYELASTYLYLSFISLIFFLIQVTAYIIHVLTTPSDLLTIAGWVKNFYYVPLTLGFYVLFTFLYNLHFYKVFEKKPLQKLSAKWGEADRKALIFVSLVVFIALFSIVAQKFGELKWISSLDTILFAVFFMMFVSFYWSSAFQFSRYVITFEHHFKECGEKIIEFGEKNLRLIREMDSKFSRKKESEDEKKEKASDLLKKETTSVSLKKEKTSVSLKALALLCVLLLSTIAFSAYWALSNPTAHETFVIDYSKTTMRVLNLTAGECVSIWFSTNPPVLAGPYSTGSVIRFYAVDPNNQTVLDAEGIAGTNPFFPMFFLASEKGSYVMNFDNSIGDPINKIVSFSYRINRPILGLPIEYMLLYVSFSLLVLVLALIAMMVIRKSQKHTKLTS